MFILGYYQSQSVRSQLCAEWLQCCEFTLKIFTLRKSLYCKLTQYPVFQHSYRRQTTQTQRIPDLHEIRHASHAEHFIRAATSVGHGMRFKVILIVHDHRVLCRFHLFVVRSIFNSSMQRTLGWITIASYLSLEDRTTRRSKLIKTSIIIAHICIDFLNQLVRSCKKRWKESELTRSKNCPLQIHHVLLW